MQYVGKFIKQNSCKSFLNFFEWFILLNNDLLNSRQNISQLIRRADLRALPIFGGSICADRTPENKTYLKLDNCICGVIYAVILIRYILLTFDNDHKNPAFFSERGSSITFNMIIYSFIMYKNGIKWYRRLKFTFWVTLGVIPASKCKVKDKDKKNLLTYNELWHFINVIDLQ